MVAATVANYRHPEYPGLEDFGEAVLRGNGDTRQLAELYAARFGSDSAHALGRILDAIAKTNGETSEFRS